VQLVVDRIDTIHPAAGLVLVTDETQVTTVAGQSQTSHSIMRTTPPAS